MFLILGLFVSTSLAAFFILPSTGIALAVSSALTGAATILISIPLHVFHLLRVPAEMDAEKSAEIASLSAASEARDNSEKLTTELGDLLRRARRLIDDYMGDDGELAIAAELLGKSTAIAEKCDARTRAIILGDDRQSYDFKRWRHIIFEDEEWPVMARLALRVQAIEKATGL